MSDAVKTSIGREVRQMLAKVSYVATKVSSLHVAQPGNLGVDGAEDCEW